MLPNRLESLAAAATSSYRLRTQASISGMYMTGAASRSWPNIGQVSQVLPMASSIEGCCWAASVEVSVMVVPFIGGEGERRRPRVAAAASDQAARSGGIQ